MKLMLTALAATLAVPASAEPLTVALSGLSTFQGYSGNKERPTPPRFGNEIDWNVSFTLDRAERPRPFDPFVRYSGSPISFKIDNIEFENEPQTSTALTITLPNVTSVAFIVSSGVPNSIDGFPDAFFSMYFDLNEVDTGGLIPRDISLATIDSIQFYLREDENYIAVYGNTILSSYVVSGDDPVIEIPARVPEPAT